MYLQFYFQSLWKKQFQSDPLYNIVASIVRSYVVLYLSLSHARYCKYWKSEEDVRITILQFDYLFNIIQVLGILIWLMIHKGGRLPQPLYRSTVARLSSRILIPRPWKASIKLVSSAMLILMRTMSYCRFLLIMPFTAGRNQVYFESMCENRIHPRRCSGYRKWSSDLCK